MATYPPALLDEIRAGVDIVELVGRFVNLAQGAAENCKGLCPFHGEKTPSFTVNPKGIFHCFGCGVGRRRLRLPHAAGPADVPRGGARAGRAGRRRPARGARAPAGESGREELYRAMELAASFYSERAVDGRRRARPRVPRRRAASPPRSRGASGSAGRPRAGTTLPDALRVRASATTRCSAAGLVHPPREQAAAPTTASAAGCSSRSATCRAASSPSAAGPSATSSRST